jgi:ElaB/YqjD/DUF883 family membrane-anchored ribosome-binding protein
MRTLRQALLIVCSVLVAASAWAAQAPVSAADLNRLDATASGIRTQVDSLRKTDPTLATEVEKSLQDLTDEITYLKVKLRREGSVTRDEYASLRDRLETLRVRAEGQKAEAQPAPTAAAAGTVPVGTQLDVKLQTPLNSGTAKVEQRFEATTMVDYPSTGQVLIPAGSIVRGFVSSVRPAGRIDRRGSLTLSFDEIVVNHRSQRLRASVTQALDSKDAATQDNTRIGAGAAVGAIIGGILGGVKGALLGVVVGGGGTIAATEGADVDLPVGTVLRIRLDEALNLAGGAPASTTAPNPAPATAR